MPLHPTPSLNPLHPPSTTHTLPQPPYTLPLLHYTLHSPATKIHPTPPPLLHYTLTPLSPHPPDRNVSLQDDMKVKTMNMNIAVALSDLMSLTRPHTPSSSSGSQSPPHQQAFARLMSLLPELHYLNTLHSEKLLGKTPVTVVAPPV